MSKGLYSQSIPSLGKYRRLLVYYDLQLLKIEKNPILKTCHVAAVYSKNSLYIVQKYIDRALY